MQLSQKVGNTMHVLGGEGDGGVQFNTHWKFNLTDNTWTKSSKTLKCLSQGPQPQILDQRVVCGMALKSKKSKGGHPALRGESATVFIKIKTWIYRDCNRGRD